MFNLDQTLALDPNYDTLRDGSPEMTLANELSANALFWEEVQELSIEDFKKDFE